MLYLLLPNPWTFDYLIMLWCFFIKQQVSLFSEVAPLLGWDLRRGSPPSNTPSNSHYSLHLSNSRCTPCMHGFNQTLSSRLQWVGSGMQDYIFACIIICHSTNKCPRVLSNSLDSFDFAMCHQFRKYATMFNNWHGFNIARATMTTSTCKLSHCCHCTQD